MSYGLDCCTLDAEGLRLLHSCEGSLLMSMFGRRTPATESWDIWRPRRLDHVRRQFCDEGFQSITQLLCARSFNVARSVAQYVQGQLAIHSRCTARETDTEDGRDARRRIDRGDGRCSRTFLDSRGTLLLDNPEWTSRRDDLTSCLHASGQLSLARSGTRRRFGPTSIGQRTWQYPYREVLGPCWWDGFDDSYTGFVKLWRTILGHFNKHKIFEYWYVATTGPSWSSTQFEAKQSTEGTTPEALEKQSKRLATRCQRATVWDVLSEGIGVDLQGDSILVSSWLQGKWRCHNQGYAGRLAECVETMYELSCRANIRAASVGRDIYRHEYREDNTRADELTHLAREGRTFYSNQVACSPIESQYLIHVAYRGACDGGVDGNGCGCGFWLQKGFLDCSQ